MKEGMIFAIVTVIMAIIVSALPFILCVWVEKYNTNYGVILALFVAPIVRTVNKQKGEEE